MKYIGISECSAATLRRAHAVYPIAALQIEYSPFYLDPEDKTKGLIPVAQELGITVVAFSPLGNGILTGRYVRTEHSSATTLANTLAVQKSPDDFEESDLRRMLPRYVSDI